MLMTLTFQFFRAIALNNWFTVKHAIKKQTLFPVDKIVGKKVNEESTDSWTTWSMFLNQAYRQFL